MSAFRRVESASRSGAIGILVPPGQPTVVVIRRRFDVGPSTRALDGEGTPPVLCQFEAMKPP
jgi:hypothetical protein